MNLSLIPELKETENQVRPVNHTHSGETQNLFVPQVIFTL